MGRNQYDGEIEGQMSFEDFFPAPQRMFAVSKIFARARKQMNIDEYKTFVYALTNIDWTREMPETITLDKKELAEILGIDSDPNLLSRDIKRKINQLSPHSFTEFSDDDKQIYISGTIINTVCLTQRNKVILDFNKRYAKLFSELTSDYITMWSTDIFNMTSERSITFYEHLRAHSDTTQECEKGFGVKALKEMFNLPVDAYMRTKGGFDRTNFEKRIIDPICEDLAKCEMIQLTVQPDGKYYEKIKQGTRVLGYKFTWNVSDRPRIANATEIKQLRDDIIKHPQTMKIAKDIIKGNAKKKDPAKNTFTTMEQSPSNPKTPEAWDNFEQLIIDN